MSEYKNCPECESKMLESRKECTICGHEFGGMTLDEMEWEINRLYERFKQIRDTVDDVKNLSKFNKEELNDIVRKIAEISKKIVDRYEKLGVARCITP